MCGASLCCAAMTDKSLVAWRNTPCTFSIFLLYEASFYILPPLPLKNNISICSYNAHRGEEGRQEGRKSEKNKYKITFPFRKMEWRIYKTAQVTSTKSHGLTSYIRQLDPEMFIKAQHWLLHHNKLNHFHHKLFLWLNFFLSSRFIRLWYRLGHVKSEFRDYGGSSP